MQGLMCHGHFDVILLLEDETGQQKLLVVVLVELGNVMQVSKYNVTELRKPRGL